MDMNVDETLSIREFVNHEMLPLKTLCCMEIT